jgi:starch synthase
VTVLIGHPTGNPNSHNAALAHLEAGRLEAFCTPWMPARHTISVLKKIPGASKFSNRLARRSFAPLQSGPIVQNRTRAIRSFLERAMSRGGDVTAAIAGNEWLMRTMDELCAASAVTAVHSFEDCSLKAFEHAKQMGKACIYDMPIGYFRAWRRIDDELNKKYDGWALEAGQSGIFASDEQKINEMALADLVLVPSTFVEHTVREYYPNRVVSRAPYGVDTGFWTPPVARQGNGRLRVIFAGQACVRKGTPLLLEAWNKAALPDAELRLIGAWRLNEQKKRWLPENVTWIPPCSSAELRRQFQLSDVMVFPSNFEGFGLVLLEAMACGLPVVTTSATAGGDLVSNRCGRVLNPEDLDQLIDALRWLSVNRDSLPSLGKESRNVAAKFSWEAYRNAVKTATAPYI